MSVELKDIEIGSVVIDNRGAIGIVTDIVLNRPTWPIVFAVKASGSLYKGRPDLFKAVIGKVDIAAFKAASKAPADLPERKDMSDIFPGLIPEPLRSMGLKVGDKINVNHGFSVVEAIYDGYKFSRPKYPITYTINGKRWKGAASVVVGKVA
jgi:hypothetical protein